MKHFTILLIALLTCNAYANNHFLMGQLYERSPIPYGWPTSCRSKTSANYMLDGKDLTGKKFLMSGADGNIATAVQIALAKSNGTVIMGCRSQDKCEAALKQIRASTKMGVVEIAPVNIDLSSKASIHAFADAIISKYGKIDALINSAGMAGGGDKMTHDGTNLLFAVNNLGPALLTDLLLKALRGGGRVVNVTADVYGTSLDNITIDDLTTAATSINKQDLSNFGVAKFLLGQHAKELAKREKDIVTFAANPNYSIANPNIPQWLEQLLIKSPLASWDWFLDLLRLSEDDKAHIKRGHYYCTVTLKDLDSCPQAYDEAAANIAVAAAFPGIESFSGSFLDFETVPGVDADHHQLLEPTCVPRPAPKMNDELRSQWYDKMLEIMRK